MKALLLATMVCSPFLPSTHALTLKESSNTHSTFVKIERNGRTVFESVQQFEETARAAVLRQIEAARRPGFGFNAPPPIKAPKRARTFIDPDSETQRVTVNFYEGTQRTFTIRFAKNGTISKIYKRGEPAK